MQLNRYTPPLVPPENLALKRITSWSRIPLANTPANPRTCRKPPLLNRAQGWLSGRVRTSFQTPSSCWRNMVALFEHAARFAAHTPPAPSRTEPSDAALLRPTLRSRVRGGPRAAWGRESKGREGKGGEGGERSGKEGRKRRWDSVGSVERVCQWRGGLGAPPPPPSKGAARRG